MEATKTRIKPGIYQRYIKRLLDILLSGLAILVLSPVLLVLAILVRTRLGSPVLFRQPRPGRGGKIFSMCKFRSMTDERDENGQLLPDEKRLTRLGRLLRSTSLDELPELFCIFRGDMSIVGPRPLLPSYLPWYTPQERRRHDVRPGLTGLAQVNGRSFISWEEIFRYDIAYVDRVTFWEDVKIVLKTVQKVFVRENIADVSQARLEADGRYHIILDGKDYVFHEPLDVERSKQVCKEK